MNQSFLESLNDQGEFSDRFGTRSISLQKTLKYEEHPDSPTEWDRVWLDLQFFTFLIRPDRRARSALAASTGNAPITVHSSALALSAAAAPPRGAAGHPRRWVKPVLLQVIISRTSGAYLTVDGLPRKLGVSLIYLCAEWSSGAVQLAFFRLKPAIGHLLLYHTRGSIHD